MTALLALRSAHSTTDCYGVLAADNILYEVSYDTDDLEGTYRVPGHPTVVDVWVSTYTLTGNTCAPPPPPPPTLTVEKIESYLPDPTLYVTRGGRRRRLHVSARPRLAAKRTGAPLSIKAMKTAAGSYPHEVSPWRDDPR